MRKVDQIVESKYIWPVDRRYTPDDINISFDPRIRKNRKRLHGGIDLYATTGDPVRAIESGEIHLAGPSDSPRWKSGHVVIKIQPKTKNSRPLFVIYLGLGRIGKNIEKGVKVKKGGYIGNVGAQHATYPHLHIEFRSGKLDGRRINPLNFLPFQTV